MASRGPGGERGAGLRSRPWGVGRGGGRPGRPRGARGGGERSVGYVAGAGRRRRVVPSVGAVERSWYAAGTLPFPSAPARSGPAAGCAWSELRAAGWESRDPGPSVARAPGAAIGCVSRAGGLVRGAERRTRPCIRSVGYALQGTGCRVRTVGPGGRWGPLQGTRCRARGLDGGNPRASYGGT